MVAVVGGVACFSCGTAEDALKFIFDSNRKFVSNLTKCASFKFATALRLELQKFGKNLRRFPTLGKYAKMVVWKIFKFNRGINKLLQSLGENKNLFIR